MDVLISSLKEELETSKQLEKKYLRKLEELPQGSFIVRKMGEQQYGYLTKRENGKVTQTYLGPLDEKQILEYREKNKKKRMIKEQLKKARAQIKILERALRGKAK